jgi:hypothetical protein
MQARVASVTLTPKAVVVIGGLFLPYVPVKVEQVKSVPDKHAGATVIGVCFIKRGGSQPCRSTA